MPKQRRYIIKPGLPQEFREKYGKIKEFRMYSRAGWDAFNNSDAGAARAKVMKARNDEKTLKLTQRPLGNIGAVARTPEVLLLAKGIKEEAKVAATANTTRTSAQREEEKKHAKHRAAQRRLAKRYRTQGVMQ